VSSINKYTLIPEKSEGVSCIGRSREVFQTPLTPGGFKKNQKILNALKQWVISFFFLVSSLVHPSLNDSDYRPHTTNHQHHSRCHAHWRDGAAITCRIHICAGLQLLQVQGPRFTIGSVRMADFVPLAQR
jgi:hypothetical protein